MLSVQAEMSNARKTNTMNILDIIPSFLHPHPNPLPGGEGTHGRRIPPLPLGEGRGEGSTHPAKILSHFNH